MRPPKPEMQTFDVLIQGHPGKLMVRSGDLASAAIAYVPE